MKTTTRQLVLLLIALTLSSCNLVSDYGNTSASDRDGYLKYSNKTLNISVLTPQEWKSQVTIGGEYVMRPVDSNDDSIAIAQSTAERMLGREASEITTLEAFHHLQLSQINEEIIGPELTVMDKKTSLSGHDAYQIFYSYRPKGMKHKLFTQITYTMLKGKIYLLSWYGLDASRPHYRKEFEVIKSSYTIL